MKTLNVFFIHNTVMRERDQVLSQFRAVLAKYSSDKLKIGKVTHVESFDPNAIDMSIIQKTVNYAPYEQNHVNAKFNGLIKNLHIYQLSNTLKHLKALEVVSQTESDELSLILEDDVSYDQSTVMKQIEKVIELYQDNSIVFLGLPNNKPQIKEIIIEPTSNLFEILPYNDSYILDKVTAKALFEQFLPIKYVNNIQLTTAIQSANVKSYQCIPNIFVDGSKLGTFTSSLNVNNVLMFNADYMRIRSIAMKEPVDITNEDKEIVRVLSTQSPCAPHPDFQYMKAVFLTKIGNYEDAEATYQSAHDTYSRNLCIMNHESQFLKDFMALYKNMQS